MVTSFCFLRTELTKMMVDMEVTPSKPGRLGHSAEYRMQLRIERPRLRRDVGQQRLELRDVSCEIDRLRPCHLLIDFRSRGDAGRPRKGNVQGDPFDDRPMKQACGMAHGLLTCYDEKGVA